jgi:uncharacterized protein DUF5656
MLEQTKLSPPPALLARLSLIVSFVLVGLTLSFILDLPSQRLELSLLGSEASFTVSGTWFIALLLAALTATGVDSIARTHPRVHLADRRYLFILWIVPAMIVVAATVILANTTVRVYGLVGVILAGAFLVATVLSEYFTIDLSDRLYNYARLGVNLAVYLLALILFGTIYGWKIRSLFSATAIGLAAGLLSLELFRGAESELRRTWLYAAAVGLSIGEILWAFNYWNLNAHLGGALLLVFFYGFTGLVQQHLWGRLNRIVWFEFFIIIIGALALLFALRPL